MNINDIFKQMQRGGELLYKYDSIPVEKLDEFIERACKRLDYNLFLLFQDLAFKLEQGKVLSLEEVAIYPHILGRLQERMKEGEQ